MNAVKALTPMQAAVALDCSISTVYRHVRNGVLTTHDGPPLMLDGRHVDAVLAQRDEALTRTLDVPSAATYMGLSEGVIYHLVRIGRLIPYPLPVGRLRITKESIEEYLSVSV